MDAIWVLQAEGVSEAEIGWRLGLAKSTVSKYLERRGGIREALATCSSPRAGPPTACERGSSATEPADARLPRKGARSAGAVPCLRRGESRLVRKPT